MASSILHNELYMFLSFAKVFCELPALHLNIHFPTRYCGEKYEYPTGDATQ